MSFPAVLWTRMVVGVIGRRGHLQAMLQINSLPLEPTLHPHPPRPSRAPTGSHMAQHKHANRKHTHANTRHKGLI